MHPISRRRALRDVSLAGLALLIPAEVLAACGTGLDTPATTETGLGVARTSGRRWLVFTAHEAAVVEEATARIAPGPSDDPSEAGHPGAREADVVRYIDTMLGALSLSPAKVFAGGPFSNRAGSHEDDMATFIGLSPAEAHGWRIRLAALRSEYTTGVVALDSLAGGDFARASNDVRDRVLAKDPGGFMTLLFSHTIEGMYSPPEYGGNRGLVGWKDISFPGDDQPRGFTPDEVTLSDGPDPYHPDAVASKLLQLIDVSSGK